MTSVAVLRGVVEGEIGVAMGAEVDAPGAAEGVRLDNEDLLAGVLHPHAEAWKFVVPRDGVLAVDREAVHGALGEGAVLALHHVAGAPSRCLLRGDLR
ncbi:MAG: hypothetical protein OXL68_01145 [Paracoccaceae bacterium]|nr:hypothetical protein [Paracoccaceae bacterium]